MEPLKHEPLMEALGLTQEPLGIFYTDRQPSSGYAPRAQVSLGRLAEASDGEMHWNSCVLGKVRRACRENKAAYFDHTRYGCLGGAFFMGFKPHYEDFEPDLLSTGIPGRFEGERYVDGPETGKAFYDGFEPPRATGRFLVIQPLGLFKKDEQPELVAFFPGPGALIGLNGLTTFVTSDPQAVCTPFGMACCNLIAWPRKLLCMGEQKAVVGCFDINGLKYLKTGGLTYVVPFRLFKRMVAVWPESVLGTRAWERLKDV
ncbi:hypothetical protein DSCO28_31210 [Desulfosarcina ovata subsp. sediminis]|uniref:DUF169 domain-containing protein n=1 Tax=Desulfosarcina ovata subsp. sediminis TaxID=885957 RepID=A0A5K7ZP65_9BACT|nr:DUF169 domain-containing protein [Desulfosarcina ovata]BBO82555.1 hypothetical protein DSCO28_31210 [Desulfosarcina ovata subsp. sediminis]